VAVHNPMSHYVPLSKRAMQHWIHPGKYRYYQAELVADLFGDWSLVRTWGGLGTPRGGDKVTGVAGYEDGLREIEALGAHRQKRGYVPVESLAYWAFQIRALRLAGLLRSEASPVCRQTDPAQGDLLTDAPDGSDLLEVRALDDLQEQVR